MTIVWMLIALLVAATLASAAKARSLWNELQELRAYVDSLPTQSTPVVIAPPANIENIALPGAGFALAKPPSDFRITMQALRAKGGGDYRFPLGWYTSVDGPDLLTARFVDDVNHILITGQTDSGKDNAALGMLLALTQQHGPDRVQFAIIDGKGLDWIGWEGKAHTWHLATAPEQISGAMKALTNERMRRYKVLKQAGAKKWDSYRGDDLPLLVVFVSELLLLQTSTSKSELTDWLETELTSARSFGIRYIIATQTASNFSTQWRSQISLFLSGNQPSPTQDAPNTGLTTSEIRALRAAAPSELPTGRANAGVFCAVQLPQAVNLRTTYISDQHAEYLLLQLPESAKKTLHKTEQQTTQPAIATKPAGNDDMLLTLLQTNQPLPFDDETGSTREARFQADKSTFGSTEAPGSTRTNLSVGGGFEALPVAAEEVTLEEQRQIIEAAKTAKSRSQVCQELYGTRGGRSWRKVQMVCDAAGLLLPKTAAAA